MRSTDLRPRSAALSENFLAGAGTGMVDRKLGVVVIGRNEGDRLKACLASLNGVASLVYVDSGSQDGSMEFAAAQGIDTIALTTDRPFTAARARNAGIRHLLARNSGIEFIQTVDGDCTMAPGWLDVAAATLRASSKVSTIFGRLRERYPDLSVYNRLCDAEWNVPVGEAESCGGIAMHRAATLAAAGCFNEALIAGEEPDLCLRLRRAGWSIVRIDAEMGNHDANILRFAQWWRRTVRAGFAYADHVWRHRSSSLPSWKRQTARFAFWGAVLPATILALLVIFGLSGWPLAWALLPMLAYPSQFVRIWLRERRRSPFAARAAAFSVIGKFAEAWGALKFLCVSATRRKAGLIEYK